MATAVDIYVLDDISDPISGVVVNVYNEAGDTFITTATTDVDGLASFLLPTDLTYQTRYYKFACALPNPTMIAVVGEDLNEFNVYGTPYVMPSATDPRLCKASGFMRLPVGGGVARGVVIRFIPMFNPAILEGALVIASPMSVRTDKNGYVEVQLIRFAQYNVVVEGIEDQTRIIHVPDSPFVNINHLIFPVVREVTFDLASPSIQVAVGATVNVPTHVFTSDLREFDQISSDVAWVSGDDTLFDFTLNAGSIDITGMRLGTTTLTATRRETSVVTIPDPGVLGGILTIEVTWH